MQYTRRFVMGMLLLLFYFPVIFVAAIFGYTIESLEALVNSWAFPIAILIFIAWVIVAICLLYTSDAADD